MTIRPKWETRRKPSKADERYAYEAVMIRDGYKCVKCRRHADDLQRDHRKNRSQGGYTVLSGLQLLCSSCHRWKTENPRQAVAEGWACPGWADPAQWPAARWFATNYGTLRLGWAKYDDDGDVIEISDEEAHQLMEGGQRGV